MCTICLKHWWVHCNAHWETLKNRLHFSPSSWSCKTAARTMSGSPSTGGSNPRKFSEKIALHNQKQAEETRAFEQLMTDLTVSRVNTLQFQLSVSYRWSLARMCSLLLRIKLAPGRRLGWNESHWLFPLWLRFQVFNKYVLFLLTHPFSGGSKPTFASVISWSVFKKQSTRNQNFKLY